MERGFDCDVLIAGGGVVGCAIARELMLFDLRVTLLEAGADVGAGTSKANTALLHTGFDAKPGTLEASLVVRGYEQLGRYAERVGIPVERIGALLVSDPPKPEDSYGINPPTVRVAMIAADEG